MVRGTILGHTSQMIGKLPTHFPPGLRPVLEDARLESLALIRAIDQMPGAARLLKQRAMLEFMTLDADCAEALGVLVRPPKFEIDWKAMLQDTMLSLQRLPATRANVRQLFNPTIRASLIVAEALVLESLDAAEAYNDVPEGAPVER